MTEVLWLGTALGAGEALAIGPIFLAIVQQSAARGFGAGCRVILGATVCDAVMLLPVLLCAGVFGIAGGVTPWLGAFGALCFVYLGQAAGRDAHRLWRGSGPRIGAATQPFWQGLVGSLANPLAWTLWFAADAPALLHARQAGGYGGLILFVIAWFGAAMAVEAGVAYAAARGAGLLGARGQACISGSAAMLFLGLAGQLATSSLPALVLN